jgi:hypothetical protein
MYLLYVYVLIVCLYIHLYVYVSSSATWHSSATLTEVFPCFFLSFKANARVKPANTGHGRHSSKILVLFYVLFVLCRSVLFLCKCLLNYCHRVATQLQLINISHHITLYQHVLNTVITAIYTAGIWNQSHPTNALALLLSRMPFAAADIESKFLGHSRQC